MILEPHPLPEEIRQTIVRANLPSPSPVLLRLMEALQAEETPLDTLAEMIGQDAALSARLLTVANSAAFARGRPVTQLKQAVGVLGLRMLQTLATCLSVQRLFQSGQEEAHGRQDDFWTHSLQVAMLARRLASRIAPRETETAYLAGLLHDTGQLILAKALGESYRQLLGSVSDEPALVAGEMQALAASHAEVAAWMIDGWALDSGLADAVRAHHVAAEEYETLPSVALCVWLAHHCLVLGGGDESTADALGAVTLDDVSGRLATPVDLSWCLEQRAAVLTEVQTVVKVLGLSATSAPDAWYWSSLRPSAAEAGHAPCALVDPLLQAVGRRAVLQPLQDNLLDLASGETLHAALLEAGRILFDLGLGAILEVDREAKQLTGLAWPAQARVFAQARIPLHFQAAIAVQALQGRRVCFSEIGTAGMPLIEQQFARALGTPGLMAVPVLQGDSVTGVLLYGVTASDVLRLSAQSAAFRDFGQLAGRVLERWAQTQSRLSELTADAQARWQVEGRRIIHEVGNPIGILKSYLTLLGRRLPEAETVHGELQAMREELDRVAAIVQRLSAVPEGTIDGTDPAQLLREMQLLYQGPLFDSPGHRLQLDLRAPSGRVAVPRDALKQLVLNLWKNAAEAMSTAGELRVTLHGPLRHAGRAYLVLDLADRGPGMPPGALAALQGEAMASSGARGHGLAIVGEIARAHGIVLSVATPAGGGTLITLWLPLSEAPTISGGEA